MKKAKKWMIVVSIMSVFISISVYGKSYDQRLLSVPTPIFDHINKINSSLEISSNGKAMATGYIRTMTGENVSLTVKLQQYKNGSWNTLYTWSDEDLYSCTVQKERVVAEGYKYRVETTGKVYDEKDKLLESVTVHSQTEYY